MLLFNEQKNQLCNRLFALLPVIAFSIENQEKLVVLFFPREYLSLFPNLKNHPLFRFSLVTDTLYPKGGSQLLYTLIKTVGRIATLHRRSFSFRNVSKKKNRLLYVKGWKDRCSPSYIKEHFSTIKHLFEPPPNIIHLVQGHFAEKKDKLIIGVHIRRGDYRTHKNGRFYYEDSVYSKAMNELSSYFNSMGIRVCFLLCSNEPISEELVSLFETIDLPDRSQIIDLYALSCCHYIIGPPSTYSQWASFIGKVPIKFITSPSEKLCITDFGYVESLDSFNQESHYTSKVHL